MDWGFSEFPQNGELTNDPYIIGPDPTPEYRSFVKAANMAILGSSSPRNVMLDRAQEARQELQTKEQKEEVERVVRVGCYPWEAEKIALGYEVIPPSEGISQRDLDEIQKVIKNYKEFHQLVLSQYELTSKLPLSLQYIDSTLATNVIARLVADKIPVWLWHDEFVVPVFDGSKQESLKVLRRICDEELVNLVGSEALGELDIFLKKPK